MSATSSSSRTKIKMVSLVGARHAVPLLDRKEESELKEVEQTIEKLETRKKELERFLANPGPGTVGNRDKIVKWSNEFAEIEVALQANIAHWEQLEAKRGG